MVITMMGGLVKPLSQRVRDFKTQPPARWSVVHVGDYFERRPFHEDQAGALKYAIMRTDNDRSGFTLEVQEWIDSPSSPIGYVTRFVVFGGKVYAPVPLAEIGRIINGG